VLSVRERPKAAEDLTFPVPDGFRLGSGESLPGESLRIRRHGDNVLPNVLVMGGISASRRLNGPDGWWSDIVGSGLALDTDRYCAIGVDFAPHEDIRVRITPQDQAQLIAIALDELSVEHLSFIGASYGGMVGLAFAQAFPERTQRLCVISAAHRPHALGSAWRGVQRRMVEFALEQGAPEHGLSLARQLAMVTYRSAEEFETRFRCTLDQEGQSDLDRYLVSRGEAFLRSMPPRRWLSLSEAIDRTDVAPELVTAPTTLIACSSDQLTPWSQMEDIAKRLPRLKAFHTISSLYGHDAFLKEPRQLSRLLRAFLDSPT
jgi:homoserine O-acetyltransferase